jgi:hypothetical protein
MQSKLAERRRKASILTAREREKTEPRQRHSDFKDSQPHLERCTYVLTSAVTVVG